MVARDAGARRNTSSTIAYLQRLASCSYTVEAIGDQRIAVATVGVTDLVAAMRHTR